MNTQELVIKNRPNAINMVNKGSSAYIESVPPIVDILAVLHRKVIGYDAQILHCDQKARNCSLCFLKKTKLNLVLFDWLHLRL
jgi:transketolase N-terminal domain/subunit